MRTFLKRTLVASALVTPGLLAGGAVASMRAEEGKHQYYIGTQGESCSGTCISDRHICCTIVIEN